MVIQIHLYLRIQILNREKKIYFTFIPSRTDYHLKNPSIFPGIHRTLLQQRIVCENLSFFKNTFG